MQQIKCFDETFSNIFQVSNGYFYSPSFKGGLALLQLQSQIQKTMENTELTELVINRLKKERKEWRCDHPFGFVAKPLKNRKDGSLDFFKWHCSIPGPQNSPWEGSCYSLSMNFDNDYPVKPPKCIFNPVIPHPNVYPSGAICLSILSEEQTWKPSTSVKQILVEIQMLLKNEPNINSAAQQLPLSLYKQNKEEYQKMVKEFAQRQKRFI